MRPTLWMATALALGIAAAQWLRPHPMVALVAIVALAVWGRLTRRHVAAVVLVTILLAGTLRYSYIRTAGRGDVGAWEGERVTLVGTVSQEPELDGSDGAGRGTYIVRAESIDGHPANGLVSVSQRGSVVPAFGERVSVAGLLTPPPGPRVPGGFDRAAYLSRQGVYHELEAAVAIRQGPGALHPWRRAAVQTRLHLEGILRQVLPEEQAALAAGLLFGTRSDLPDDLKEAFRVSGVFHLLAVSGGNIALLLMTFLLILRRFGIPKRVAAGAGIPFVILFVFLTGASPSVLRAGLMAVLVLAAEVLGRERDATSALGATVMVLLVWQPALLFDIGFQLSVAATLGILRFARPLERWLVPRTQAVLGERVGGWAAAGLAVTFAAQLFVEPISLYHFGAFSAIAPVANQLVLAFLDPVLKVGVVTALVGFVSVPLAWSIGWLVRGGLWALVFLVKATAAVPGAYLYVGHLPAGGVLLWYCGLLLVTSPEIRHAVHGRLRRIESAWSSTDRTAKAAIAIGVSLALITGWTWRLALADPGDSLRITFLDVGQGDAIVIQAPNGQTMLIDAGPAVAARPEQGRPAYDAGEAVVVPFLHQAGIRTVDYFVLTHPDQDHAGGGAAVLRALPVRALLRSGEKANEVGYNAALAAASTLDIPVSEPLAGDEIRLGEVLVQVLGPSATRLVGTRSDDNSNCIALRLVYRNVSALLTCDLEAVAEERLVTDGVDLRADILKVSHHGSGHSSTPAFLNAVQPEWAVISAGRGNPYGHPHRDTVQRLGQVGAQIYRTDLHGTITMQTDGVKIIAEGARGSPVRDGKRPLGILGRRWLFAW